MARVLAAISLLLGACAALTVTPQSSLAVDGPPSCRGQPPIYGPVPQVPPSLRRRLAQSRAAASRTHGANAMHNQGLVAVAFQNASSQLYLGSPSIARLDEDTLLVSHDFFPLWGQRKSTAVYASKDGGASWQRRSLVADQFWSTLFVHRGALYLVGTDGDGFPEWNAVMVSRSLDGGRSWNQSRVLRPPAGCHFATGATAMLLQGGFLYRGMESWCGHGWDDFKWPQSYLAHLISVPADADLLDPSAWSMSQGVQFDSDTMLPAWMPAPVVSGGYLEGNAVPLPGGKGVGLLLRCRVYDSVQPADGEGGWGMLEEPEQLGRRKAEDEGQGNEQEGQGDEQQGLQMDEGFPGLCGGLSGRSYTLQHACLFHLTPSPAAAAAAGAAAGAGAEAAAGSSPPQAPPARLAWRGFVSMPGGGNKFVARWDASSGRYLALTNPSIDRYGTNSDARNILVLVHSANLIDWRIGTTVLLANDGLGWEESLWLTGYHYTDWVVDGPDLLAAVRTAYDGAHTFHDSNYITFKRIERYRQYLN